MYDDASWQMNVKHQAVQRAKEQIQHDDQRKYADTGRHVQDGLDHVVVLRAFGTAELNMHHVIVGFDGHLFSLPGFCRINGIDSLLHGSVGGCRSVQCGVDGVVPCHAACGEEVHRHSGLLVGAGGCGLALAAAIGKGAPTAGSKPVC